MFNLAIIIQNEELGHSLFDTGESFLRNLEVDLIHILPRNPANAHPLPNFNVAAVFLPSIISLGSRSFRCLHISTVPADDDAEVVGFEYFG